MLGVTQGTVLGAGGGLGPLGSLKCTTELKNLEWVRGWWTVHLIPLFYE